MSYAANDFLEEILRGCAAAEPQPWYPRDYARARGIDRDSLDRPLERLRLGGLVQLTDWVQGLGQGYALTPEGARVLKDPLELDRLRAGELPDRRVGQPEAAAEKRRRAAHEGERSAARPAITPVRPVVSYVLIAANVAVFMYGVYLALRNQYEMPGALSADSRVLRQTGALNGSYLLAGHWWRLLTCCFVHIGWAHLAANMYSLYAIGPLSEVLW